MRLRCALGLLAALSVAVALRAATAVDSTITAATVYLDRAVVTRTASIDLAVGEQQLVFEKLPAALVDDSLQIAGRGTAHVTILDVTANPQWLDATSNDRVRALEDELKDLQKQVRVLTDRGATLDQQQALLVAIGKAATTPPPAGKDAAIPPRPSNAEWQQLIDFYGAGFDKLAAERQTISTEREKLDAKIAAVNEQLGQLRGNHGKSVKNVTVRVSVETAGKLELTLAYTLGGARWTPAYDGRFSTADRKVALGYFGIVGQNTGEDWKGIELTLSTARPSLGGAAPELPPWVVQERQTDDEVVVLSPFSVDAKKDKGYAGGRSLAGARAKMEEASVAAAPPPAPVEARQQSATVDTQATSATFRIPTKTDVPSDNAPHKVGIATVALAAELSYQATPKLLASAFLNAAVKNDSEYPVLAGPLAVFLDGTFVANAQLKAVMPGEKFDLALGADDGLRIERKLINRVTEDLGLLTKQIRVTYEAKITVTNNKRTTEKITVKDQLPVSRHEKIELKQLAPDVKAVKPDDQGVLTWTLELKPGEKRELPLKLSVTYPRDFAVTGLE